MSKILEEIGAFKARKIALETEARQIVAFRLATGIDLSEALKAGLADAEQIIRRVRRLLERERLKGLRRHWSYDLNRHIALKQALNLLRQMHGLGEPRAEARPRKPKRRPKAPLGT